MLNSILDIINNPFVPPILSALILGIGGLFNKYIIHFFSKKAQIEINNEAEKIKFEIQRKYLLTEIKTRNLLTVYPKLHDAVHEAAEPYCTYFNTISKQVNKLRASGNEPDAPQLIQFFQDYWIAISLGDGSIKTTELLLLNNEFACASLFISDEVSKIVSEMKSDIIGLFNIVKNEIYNNTYLTQDKAKLLEILNRAELLSLSLMQNKDLLAKRMNREFDPDF